MDYLIYLIPIAGGGIFAMGLLIGWAILESCRIEARKSVTNKNWDEILSSLKRIEAKLDEKETEK